MATTHNLRMGDRGRIVLPAELRRSAGFDEGTELIAIPTDEGVLLLDRERARKHVAARLAGRDLVGELISERREAARAEARE